MKKKTIFAKLTKEGYEYILEVVIGKKTIEIVGHSKEEVIEELNKYFNKETINTIKEILDEDV